MSNQTPEGITPSPLQPVLLRSPGVTLRRPTADDIPAFLQAVAESAGSPRLPWCVPGYSRRDAEAFVRRARDEAASGAALQLHIFDDDKRVLGGMSFNSVNPWHRMATVGYWIRPSARGSGVAFAAGRMLVRHGFDVMGLTRLEICAAADNIPSRRLAGKLGGVLEGIARNRLYVGGEPSDAAVYSIIP